MMDLSPQPWRPHLVAASLLLPASEKSLKMETSEASTCALAMALARLLGISYTGGSL